MITLHDVPAIIAALLHNIDLFKFVLAHVGHKQPARALIKREAPRIAKAKRVYLRQSVAGGKRVVGRNRIRLARAGGVHVNAQQLAQQSLRVLPMAKGITLAAAIAQAKIEKAIWPKGKLARLMVREVVDLIHGQQNALTGWVSLVRVRR